MNDIQTLFDNPRVEKKIFLEAGSVVYRFSTEEWVLEIHENP